MIMEQEEMEMSKEELQKWIRKKVQKNKLISSDMLETFKLLQSLLEKREKRAVQLLKLCESVSACEAIVEEQYSLLGWKYKDTESDDDDDGGNNITDCGYTDLSSSITGSLNLLLPKLKDSENLRRATYKKVSISLKRKPVVVLTRLSRSEISSFCRPKPDDPVSEESYSGSDTWEPGDDSSDSDYSISSSKTGSNKRRRIDRGNGTLSKSRATRQASTSSNAESEGTKTSTSANTIAKRKVQKTLTPKGSANTDAESNASKTSTPPASTNTLAKSNVLKTPKERANTDAQSNAPKTSLPQTCTNTDAQSSAPKTSPPQTSACTNAQSNALKISAPQTSVCTEAQSNATKTSPPQTSACTNAQSNAMKISQTPIGALMSMTTSALNNNGIIPKFICKLKHAKTPPPGPTEIIVKMNVLAKRKPMSWQRGQVTEIITKEDGTLKYKILFEDKGKSLVRAHHIAYDYRPKLDQLSVGARVVVQPDPGKCTFCPGILGELPSRKNRMRFLVFMDDHTPVYVGLLLLNLVCKPLTDPLDDIPDGHHKTFLKKYLNAWPYPPQTQYRVGQSVNVEFNGVVQRCEVQIVDSSLIEVLSADEQKAWVYRGSTCLHHMSSMKELLEEKHKD
ncbi:histone-lysine N-methyltransferase SETDB1-A isoform X2 [Centropristis striata]|uniref:histone-lysine N-methyltransferase SETDB1-A isoform X2 n=1 Tax=Centropristis striata TaxID=184440 RepID=UPI0027DF5886|nr:histone-lysine N-methyltransferase SETDB1-A isoform X2 [Centropristis striata]